MTTFGPRSRRDAGSSRCARSGASQAFRAGADREKAKNEGQAYANDVIPKARGSAARLHEEAEAYKARVVARAEGDAQRFTDCRKRVNRLPLGAAALAGTSYPLDRDADFYASREYDDRAFFGSRLTYLVPGAVLLLLFGLLLVIVGVRMWRAARSEELGRG